MRHQVKVQYVKRPSPVKVNLSDLADFFGTRVEVDDKERPGSSLAFCARLLGVQRHQCVGSGEDTVHYGYIEIPGTGKSPSAAVANLACILSGHQLRLKTGWFRSLKFDARNAIVLSDVEI